MRLKNCLYIGLKYSPPANKYRGKFNPHYRHYDSRSSEEKYQVSRKDKIFIWVSKLLISNPEWCAFPQLKLFA